MGIKATELYLDFETFEAYIYSRQRPHLQYIMVVNADSHFHRNTVRTQGKGLFSGLDNIISGQ
jgi:hypothetical protein